MCGWRGSCDWVVSHFLSSVPGCSGVAFALAGRQIGGVVDFAALLRGLMREREMSGRCLARLVPCDAALISRLVCGKQRPSARMARLLDDALGASGALVEAARVVPVRGAAGMDAGWGEGGDDEVRRRELLGAMVAGPLAVQLEQIRRHLDGVAGVSASERDADEWEGVAEGYARQVLSTPAVVFLPHLLADAGEVTERLVSASGGVRLRLARSAALIGALAAIGVSALGDQMTAGRWWRTSVRVASESGDGDLAAVILGRQAVKSLYMPAGGSDALRLADRAVAAAGGRAGAGVVSAWSARAQAFAVAGRKAEARAAMVEQRRAWERLPHGVCRDAGSEFGQHERRVAHTEVWVLAKLGETRAALHALDGYLVHPGSTLSRARAELLRAEALIRGGDADGGARHCVKVLTGLPGGWRGDAEVVSSARAALAAVPAAQGSRLPVLEAREVLALSAGKG
jgi:Helix-turn-helix domain